MTKPLKKKQPRSAWQIVGFVLVALLILSMITGGVGVAWYNSENPVVTREPYYYGGGGYYDGPSRRPLRPGDRGAPAIATVADSAVEKDVRQFFNAFATVAKSPPQKNATPEPWIDSAVVLAGAKFIVPLGLTYRQPEARLGDPIVDGEALALTAALRKTRMTWRTWNWEELTVHRVNTLSPTTIEAFTSMPKPDGSRTKMRWRLRFNAFDNAYIIEHWTDLTTGISSDVEVALSLISYSSDAGRHRRLLALRSLPEAHRLMDEKKFEEARKQLDIAARAQAGEFMGFDDVYELAEARFDILDFDDDLPAVDRLDAIIDRDRSNLAALALKMRALARNRQFGEIAELARRYQERTGPDADALAWCGVEQAGSDMEDTEKAKEYFESALKLEPSHVAALNGLRKLLPDREKDDFVDRVTNLKSFQKLFHRLMDDGMYGDWKTQAKLAKAHRTLYQQDHSAARFEVQAQLMLGGYPEAIRIFQAALPKLTGEPREQLLSIFLNTSTAKNRQREAYDAVPKEDRPEAFRQAMLSWSYRLFDRQVYYSDNPEAPADNTMEKYQSLLDVHAKSHPDDTWLLLFKAKLQNHDGDRAAAEMNANTFLGKVKPTADYTKDYQSGYSEGRREWLLAKLHLGQTLAAAERYPDEPTFNELAAECARVKNHVQLSLLLAHREKVEPNTPSILYWRGETFWLKNEYTKCAAAMKSYLDSGEPGGYTMYQYQARDKLVRSWVKSNKSETALEYLKAEEIQQPLLQALALASSKNTEEAEIYLIEMMTTQAWLTHSAYTDPDLGPLLLGPAFARLRVKFPPPAPPKK